MSARNQHDADVVIIGGGVAGLWLLNLLSNRGLHTLLIEGRALGSGQTLASQGMIHGGLKYALGGLLTGASEALAKMPQRWRDCLRGEAEVDLRCVEVAADRTHLWSNGSAMGHLGTLLARQSLTARVGAVADDSRPEPFDNQAFSGQLFELNELVVDVPSLVEQLAEPYHTQMLHVNLDEQHIERSADQAITAIVTPTMRITAAHFIFAAGEGNAPFALGPVQRRGLHQVMLAKPDLPRLFGHWIESPFQPEPALTLSTHATRHQSIWYLGGQLASAGVARSATEQIAAAKDTLARALPWVDLGDALWDTVRIDRAEPARAGGEKPDNAVVRSRANMHVCWPVKLALTPDLGDRVLAALDGVPRSGRPATAGLSGPRPPLAAPPWRSGGDPDQ